MKVCQLTGACQKLYNALHKFFYNHPNWSAFLASIVLAMAMMLPSIIAGKGIFSWIGDYSAQEVVFNTRLSEIAKSGNNTFWEPYNDLGASTIGSYSFYNLTSPFVMVVWFFPASVVPYVLGIIYIIKYGVAGVTAFMFLRRVLKHKKYALLGSLLYAFSGFQLTNMLFYHFHDCVALFPLLLYALDRLIRDDKRALFIFAVAINLFTNYFFFIGEVVFLVVYYIVLNLTKYYKFTWKKFFQILLEGILGVGLGCIILIPSLLFVINNPRVNAAWTLKSMFIPSRETIQEILRAFILPNESMSHRALISPHNYTSIETYLPFVGSILWLAYLIKHPRDSFSILTFVLCMLLTVPIFNSSFVAFTNSWYSRWLYMFILILSLLSAKTIEDRVNLKSGFVGTGVILTIFLMISLYGIQQGSTFIFNEKRFIFALIIFIVDIICLSCLSRKNLYYGIMVGICSYVVIYGNYSCLTHDNHGGINNLLEEKVVLSAYENNVRYNEHLSNGTYLSNRISATTWNSNIEGTAFEFYNSLGISRGVATEIPFNEYDLNDFLSVKYIIVNGEEINQQEQKHYAPISTEDQYKIYENKDYLPFGIDYKHYISTSDFELLDQKARKKVLKEAVVLTDEQINTYKDFLTPYHSQKRTSCITNNDFSLTKNGFQADINLTSEALVVYTFAFSNNFTATLNGSPASMEKVDNGLIGIKLPQGENHLEVTYNDKGFKIGAAISTVSLVITLVYIVFTMRNASARADTTKQCA